MLIPTSTIKHFSMCLLTVLQATLRIPIFERQAQHMVDTYMSATLEVNCVPSTAETQSQGRNFNGYLRYAQNVRCDGAKRELSQGVLGDWKKYHDHWSRSFHGFCRVPGHEACKVNSQNTHWISSFRWWSHSDCNCYSHDFCSGSCYHQPRRHHAHRSSSKLENA